MGAVIGVEKNSHRRREATVEVEKVIASVDKLRVSSTPLHSCSVLRLNAILSKNVSTLR